MKSKSLWRNVCYLDASALAKRYVVEHGVEPVVVNPVLQASYRR